MALCGSKAPNCTPWTNKESLRITADPDIAGIGNVVSFLLSGFITTILASMHTLMDDGPQIQSNGLDHWILRKLRTYSPWHLGDSRPLLRPVLQKVVLELSDQQLLLGIAMLFAGLYQRCTITEYHFSMVRNLAWMSSSVHIATLVVHREYLQDTPKLRTWRILLLAVMFAFMVTYAVLTAHNDWDFIGAYPAQCLFSDLAGHISGIGGFRLFFELFQILWGYGGGVLLLYGSLSSAVDTWVVEKPVSKLEKGAQKLRQWRQQTAGKTRTISCISRAGASIVAETTLLIIRYLYSGCITFGDSQWANLFFSVGFFSYGVLEIFQTRIVPSTNMDGNENGLTFGQIVPLCMLLSIIVGSKEAFEEQRALLRNHNDSQEETPLIDQSSRKSSHALNVDEAIEMSGGLAVEDIADEARSVTVIPRHIDLEAADGRTTSVEVSDSEEEPRRRTTFPLMSFSRGKYS